MMVGVTVHIDYYGDIELFSIDNLDTTVRDLLNQAEIRFHKGAYVYVIDEYNCLCEGPNPFKRLDDRRLREIVQMHQDFMARDGTNQGADAVPKPVHLYLCNDLIDDISSENSPITNKEYHSEGTGPADNNDNSKDTHFQSTYTGSGVPPQAITDVGPTQNILNQSEDDGSFDDNLLKFTNNCRENQKIQYKTDAFPLKTNKKAKKSKSTNTKATSQTVNKKRKIYKKNKKNKKKQKTQKKKKYAFHLQAEKYIKKCLGGRYPRVQLPRDYRDLIQNGRVVPVFVAVTKRIGGQRYLDPLKGFLIDKKNPKTSLENPCIMNFEWIDRENPPPRDYPLKLALIQVSGNINRKCKLKYNETFDFTQRKVNESVSKYSNYNTTDDTDDPEEFQITVVPVKGDAQLEADWSNVTDSVPMHYANGKSNKNNGDEVEDNDEEEDDDDEEE